MGFLRQRRFLPPRQIVFFTLAIAVPCGLLVVLTLRMLVQDRELADKRVADERRRIATDVRQSLLVRVETLRAAALRVPEAASDVPSDIALVARLEAGQVVLPWETATTAARRAADDPDFREVLRVGEQHEFIAAEFAAASAVYQRAAASARLPLQKLSAQLLATRALTKAGRGRDAERIAGEILRAPADALDDQGIPLAAYAARLLSDRCEPSTDQCGRVVPHLGRLLTSPVMSPAAVYMVKDVATHLATRAPALQQQLAGIINTAADRVRDHLQAVELRTAFSDLGLALPPAPLESRWVAYGSDSHLWLVSLGQSLTGPVVVAVRGPPILGLVEAAFGVSIGRRDHGEALTPNFPGLTASLAPQRLAAMATETRRQQPFFIGALVLVVTVAMAGAYLFWRDVRRELGLAQMRSQFVSSVSHELKTPLTAIRMFAETLLGRSMRPDVQQEYLETIVNESERLTRLLNNVLDFSQIEGGKKAYRRQTLSLASVVRTAAKAMQYPLAQQGFDLRVAIDEDVPAVSADPDAIEQAILNLLSNAMKYSGDGRVVEMALTRAGDRAVITVSDRGIGIPEAEQSRIFEKFYRIRDVATARVAGTGLGLTLVEHVARGHGGAIRVRSAPGHGSTFALEIPLLPEHSAAQSIARVAG